MPMGHAGGSCASVQLRGRPIYPRARRRSCYTRDVNQPKTPKLPTLICRLCHCRFHEPGAPIEYYANAHGRAVCPHCRN
jgi:hypothetical protein